MGDYLTASECSMESYMSTPRRPSRKKSASQHSQHLATVLLRNPQQDYDGIEKIDEKSRPLRVDRSGVAGYSRPSFKVTVDLSSMKPGRW